MLDENRRKIPFWAVIALIGGFFIKYWFPIALPFLLGGALALGADPAVRILQDKLRLKRWAASFLGVTAFFTLMVTILGLLVSVLVRQLGRLAGLVPQLAEAIGKGLGSMEARLLALSARLPDSMEQAAAAGVQRLFSDSSNLLDQAVSRVPQMATGLVGMLSQGAFVTFTAILSAYMISGRLPKIKHFLKQKLSRMKLEQLHTSLKGLRQGIGGWLSAQGKLMGLTFFMLCVGFFLLKTDHVLLFAALVTLVDAFPILGTGTVLIPWSVVQLLQGDTARGIGLLALYAVVWLVRSILEPRLVGRELGLDPLVTLFSIYAGFCLLGIGGMLIAPFAAMVVTQLIRQRPQTA
jgi:sporulation integral membrane protein YtvI